MSQDKNKNLLTIDYRRLGTVSEEELLDAIIDDIKLIKEKYGMKYYTGAKLNIWATNEHGDPRRFERRNGEQVRWINTSHFRPACLDYDL